MGPSVWLGDDGKTFCTTLYSRFAFLTFVAVLTFVVINNFSVFNILGGF